MAFHFNTVRNDCDTDYNDQFVTFRRRVLWIVFSKDITLNKLSKMLLAKAVMAQDETFPYDCQFGVFSVEGKSTLLSRANRKNYLKSKECNG